MNCHELLTKLNFLDLFRNLRSKEFWGDDQDILKKIRLGTWENIRDARALKHHTSHFENENCKCWHWSLKSLHTLFDTDLDHIPTQILITPLTHTHTKIMTKNQLIVDASLYYGYWCYFFNLSHNELPINNNYKAVKHYICHHFRHFIKTKYPAVSAILRILRYKVAAIDHVDTTFRCDNSNSRVG